MRARLGWLIAIAGSGAVALSAFAQGGAKLAIGPDAGGYLCPDGRQLYVKSCYDNSPYANCGVILMHLPLQRGYQQERTQTRSEITPSVADCKVYPLEFRNDGTVRLVVPKQQTTQAATPAANPAIPEPTTRTALVRISKPGVATTVHYVDEASLKSSGQKDVATMWTLQVFPNGNSNFPKAHALWARYEVDCKKNATRLTAFGEIDRLGKVLTSKPADVPQPVVKDSPSERIAAAACKSAPLVGPRLLNVAAAIADADTVVAPTTVVKPAAPVTIAKPPKTPIRLPETDTEKAVFEFIKSNQLQAAVNAIVRSPGGKLPTLTELTDKQGMTVLHWVAANRNAAGTRWLLDKGPEVDLADERGRTPLKIALDNKETRVMTLLLDNGANANFAWPGHADELKGFKKTSELVDFLIKNGAPAGN